MTDEQLTKEHARKWIDDALAAGGIGFQCCFCHDAIEGHVHALVLITNWNGPEEDQRSQQWFCHTDCFRKATGERIDVLDA